MRQIISLFLLLLMPSAALADGRFIPASALPAKVTIPDQRALICYSNGTERLVIETRFTGSGTNFAWVIPLPSRPVIEEATSGLFPTLKYLFRPRIIHYIPRYWLGILVFAGVIILVRLARRSAIDIVIYGLLTFVFLFLAGALLPVARRPAVISTIAGEAVAILDRNLVGVYETTTITSRDPNAMQTWLSENGYAVSTNLEPVITDYVKDGWVFVATKVRRDKSDSVTSTPHPLSFTFRTDRPVYPMRLTGVDNGPLSVELYVFSSTCAKAAHFKVVSCTQPNIAHPLLHQWAGDLPVATKLTATLSPTAMRQDVWLGWKPFVVKEARWFSRQGALTIALNWGVGLWAAGLIIIWFLAFVSETHRVRSPQRIGVMTLAIAILVGLIYLCLPKMEVKLVTRYSYYNSREEQITLQMALGDLNWQTPAEARAGLREIVSNPTNAVSYDLRSWDNNFVGGHIREEDSPGNYLLRETNNQLQFVIFDVNGREEVSGTWNLASPH